MKLDLDSIESAEFTEGKWFTYDEDVRFKLRYVSPELSRTLRVKHTTKRWRKGERVEELDQDAFNTELIDYVLVDWEGILVKGGKKAPVTVKNKEKLLNHATDHAVFIYDTARDLVNFADTEKAEELEKNSQTG